MTVEFHGESGNADGDASTPLDLPDIASNGLALMTECGRCYPLALMSRNSNKASISPPSDSSKNANPNEPSPLSLGRLREAFAAMLGSADAPQESETNSGEPGASTGVPIAEAPSSPPGLCEISPRSVVEAMLFVGRPDNRPVSARELAATMRGVSPAEVDAAVAELNKLYDADATPYRIDQSHAGYRLVLRGEFERMRDKFYGRVREARLSPVAIEVLSIVAYNQPVTAAAVDELRGAGSGGALSMLVRRRLLRVEKPEDTAGAPCYRTTDRFLRLFGLESLSVLPRSEELEKA
jgi:segregation and condensation protein B